MPFWRNSTVVCLAYGVFVVGDHVLFTSYAGESIEVDGDEYLLMNESEVLAVLG